MIRRYSRPAASAFAAPAILAPLLVVTPALAAPGGPIGVLPLGPYVCELPGDATGPGGIPQREAEFTVTYGSTYRTPAGQGTYLLTGDRVTFTAGPLRNAVYHRTGNTFLRRVLADGTTDRLRCVRQRGLGR